MKLFLFKMDYQGYDTYSSWLVAADNDDIAKGYHPAGAKFVDTEIGPFGEHDHTDYGKEISYACIGEAASDLKEGVSISSFNAG